MSTEQTSISSTDTPATPASQSALQTPTEAVNSGSSPSATASQEEINKLVGKARTEGKATAVADLLKALGVASQDDLKALIDDARKRAQADMSESEKAKADLDREKKAKDDLAAQLTAERLSRRQDKIFAQIERAAGQMKANDSETVLMYLKEKHGTALNEVMAEDGTIDDKKVTALLEKVKAEKPVYFIPPIATPGSQSNFGGRVQSSDTEAMKRASQINQRIIRGR